MPDSIVNSISVPPDAAVQVRKRLGLAPDAPLRMAYIAGPGDAVGTFDHWSKGEHDPRTPVIAYSSMFYTLVTALGADALILVEQTTQPCTPDPRIRFISTPRNRSRHGMRYRLDQRAFANDVLRHLREFKADVIVVGTDAPDGLIARLPKATRIVMTTHNTYWPMGSRPTSLKARVNFALKTWSLRRIDSAVNTSAECAAQLAALGGPKDRSFVDFPQVLLQFIPDAPVRQASARRLLFLGRIEANKGIFDLLGAFNTLAADQPDLMLAIAGSGSAEAALKTAVAASPFRDRITLHGRLPANKVHAELAISDLLVCPTRSDFYEGLALVVIEAAVHCVPSVLSSVVPAKQLVPDGCAEFPADDVAALTATLRRIITSPDDYAAMCVSLADSRNLFRNRGNSWGSMLYRAIVA